MSTVAFSVNEHTPDIRFLASLSDSTTVIQDSPPGEQHAWVRLQQYLKDNPGLTITGLRLQHPSRDEVVMPSGQEGYFFGNKLFKVFQGGQSDYVGIGYYDSAIVSISWYRIPHFDHCRTEERSLAKAGFFLITN
jgi:hypothetical protein